MSDAGAGLVGGMSVLVWLGAMAFISLLSVAASVVWIWMLVEVLTKETDENNNRLLWALVIIFTHLIGALVYVFARRRDRIAKLGR